MQSGYLDGITKTFNFGFERLTATLEGLTREQFTHVPTGLKNSIATLLLHLYGT